jgi:hypothetical protein
MMGGVTCRSPVITHEEIFLRLRDIFNAKMFNGNHMLEIEPMLLGEFLC